MSSRLSNYLRAHRKRLGLSQEEVSFLLGTRGGAKVCRYENFARLPSLETALACEVIFQKPVRELFGGLHDKIKREIAARAKILSYRKDRPGRERLNRQRRAALASIAAQGAKQPAKLQ